MRENDDIDGEVWVADPRERRLRAVAQLIDKPLTVLAVALAFALAARGPGLLVAGWRPPGWFVLGLWLGLSVLARLTILQLLARFRARHGLTAPGAPKEERC